MRHSNEIKFLNRVVEKHGLSEDMAPLRQELLELMAKEEQSCESMRELSESLWRDFGGLKKELEKLSAKDTEQEISNLSALLQQMTRASAPLERSQALRRLLSFHLLGTSIAGRIPSASG